MRIGALALATTLIAAGAGIATPAEAEPIEQGRYREIGSFVLADLCDDLRIHVEFDDTGHVLARITGQDDTVRYTVTGHVRSTWTNLETGRAMTFMASHLEQELRVTDNGDGTISVLTHFLNAERAYGPDGHLAYVEPGVTEMLTILDYNGTLTDASDDIFVSETFVAHHGGKPGTERDFCEDFRTLTA